MDFFDWIRNNLATILIASVPIFIQLLLYRKTRSESLKLDSESKKIQSETERTHAEIDGLMIKNASDIVNMWEGAYKELREKTQDCVDNNKTLNEKIQFLLDQTALLKTRQKVILEFVSNVMDLIKEPIKDVFIIMDEKKRFMYVSPNVFDMLGYSPLDLLNKDRSDLIYPNDLPVFDKNFSHTLQFPEVTSKILVRYKNSDGEYRWIESTVMNLLQTHVKGIFFASRDVTRIRDAENGFKELYPVE